MNRTGSKEAKRRRNTAFMRKNVLKRNATKPEIELSRQIKERGIPAAFQRVVFTSGTFYILDFIVMLKPRVIIELDGSHHDNQKWYDNQRTKRVLEIPYYADCELVRFKNHQVYSGEVMGYLKDRYSTIYPKRFVPDFTQEEG